LPNTAVFPGTLSTINILKAPYYALTVLERHRHHHSLSRGCSHNVTSLYPTVPSLLLRSLVELVLVHKAAGTQRGCQIFILGDI